MIIKIKQIVKKYPRLISFIKLFLFQIKKGYIKQIIHYVLNGHYFCKYKVTRYQRCNKIKKLQIGGGYHVKKKDWLNGDIIHGDIYLNASKKFPIQSEKFDYIFSEHFIEHLKFIEAKICLSECFRILKPGGVIRFSTPDFRGLVDLYSSKNTSMDIEKALMIHRTNHAPETSTFCHLINNYFRLWGHSFIYDSETLYSLLSRTGFRNLKRKEFGKSNFEELKDLEEHPQAEFGVNQVILIIEAEKL